MLKKEMLFSIKDPARITVHNETDRGVQVIAWGTSNTLGWERIGYLYGVGTETFLMNVPCKYVEVSLTTRGGILPGELVNAKLVEDDVRVIDMSQDAYVVVAGVVTG